ncbi:uncharacterized protein LOC131250797 isoform X4 [Magnolia sinica]|uniref:uncharacterized protein LOC131250797 isoform X4 n=1 Tax=Magnolia sinica TaxID=86752 RepID=UPI00265B258A|nr:uncharacterized protein LOC131250797 isoform X4 [Magnolia sinica]
MMQMLGFRGSASKDTSDSSPKSLSQNPKSSSPTVVAAGPRRPLRLVYCDDKGKFRMDPEAVAALQLVKGPIGVVSVCGRARQGKSFILNQLLGRSSGFQVASTHRPCTKGLWMWSAPLKRTALDGTEYYLVLLDSEGIDAYDQTGTYSTQIFSLAVLLSSMFIYNQMGGIDETALDRLSLVTEMTKHIRVRASGGRTTASELGQFSPVFVWLLRDFYLDLAEDDRKITPRDYLELALRPMQGGKDVATKNEIRESIRSLFPDRECFTLVRPLNNENDLQRLDQISDYKRNAFMEADLRCSNTLQSMEKRLRAACHAPDAKVDHVVKVLDVLLSEYETSSHGPGKWQKLATFLHQSLEGPVFDLIKKQLDQIGSEKSALMLKCRSNEDKLGLLSKQLEANEKYKADYLRRYEEAINDKKKIAEDYTSRIANLQSQCSSLEERCSSLVKALDSARLESSDWKRKYEQNFSRKKAEEDQANAEITALKSRSSAAEARAAAAREQANSAQVEASEWKRKYDIAVREAKAALEKAATIQERYNKDTQRREDALRAEFSESLAEKEDEIKDKQAKIEQAENHLMSLRLELKAAESKLKNYDLEASTLKLEIKDLSERLDSAKATAQSYEREARIMEQEKTHLEQKYQSEFKRFKEADERCRAAENEAKRAVDLADKAREEAALAQSEKSEVQRLAMERLTQIERAHRQVESLERRKADLIDEVERLRRSEMDAVSKVEFLEKQVEEREREIESLLESTKEQRENTVQVLEGLLKTERAARAEANSRAEALSLQLQSTQARLDSLQQELTSVRLNETALDSKLKTASHGKRTRVDDYVGIESVQDMEIDEENVRGRKKSKSTTSPLRTHTEDGGSIFKADGDDNHSLQTESEGHTKFTVLKLKQELTRLGFGAELLQLKNPNKKEIVALYEKHVLQK